MNIDADISISWPHGPNERADTPIEITIRDRASGTRIATLYVSVLQFTELTLGHLAHVPVSAVVSDHLDRVGKQHVRTPLIFKLLNRDDREQVATKIALELAAERFTGDYSVSTYFDSQNSFWLDGDGDLWARTSVSTWEPVNESVSNPESEG